MLIDSKSSLQTHFIVIFNLWDLYIDKKYNYFYIFLKINLIIEEENCRIHCICLFYIKLQKYIRWNIKVVFFVIKIFSFYFLVFFSHFFSLLVLKYQELRISSYFPVNWNLSLLRQWGFFRVEIRVEEMLVWEICPGVKSLIKSLICVGLFVECKRWWLLILFSLHRGQSKSFW